MLTLEDRIQAALNSLWKTQAELQEMTARYGEDPELADLSLLRSKMGHLEKQATRVGMLVSSWEGSLTLHPPEEEEATGEVTGEVEPEPEIPVKDWSDVLGEQIPDPPPAPAEPPDLSKLKQWAAGETDPTEGILEGILERLGEPKKVASLVAYHNELATLDRATEEFDAWKRLPRDTQRSLTGLVAARARHLQDEASPTLGHPYVGNAINRLFSSITAYSKDAQPGFVFGLSRGHTPVSASWLEDAQDWWNKLTEGDEVEDDNPIDAEDEKPSKTAGRALHELEQIAGEEDPDKGTLIASATECLELGMAPNHTRLVKVLHPHYRLLTREKALKYVRKAIRDYEKEIAREADAADKDEDVLPDDWPFWKYTEDKNIAIVGGDKRDTTVERFKEAFRAESVEWESSWQVRRVESLAARVESGAIDMMIMLARFMSHQAWYILVPPCKASKVPFVLVERGYGLSQVRHTMEKVLERWDGGTQ